MKKDNFEEIIHKYGKDILRFCRMTTYDKETGNELYQETMLRLLEHIEYLADDASIRNYAITTAILIWKNKLKRSMNIYK